MTIIELKQYICSKNKIEYILEDIGCCSVKYHQAKNYYSCSNANGDNKSAIVVYNDEYLKCINYTRNLDDNADLITLVQFNKQQTFVEAMKYLHKILGLKLEYKKQIKQSVKVDPLQIFKKVKYKKNKVNALDFDAIDEDVLDDYVPYVHISWFREGIMSSTVKKFGLGYSYRQRRVIIPLRYWMTGELLGTTGRTTIENYDELDIRKYFITPSYPKSCNLFGLWEHIDDIKKLGYCVVYESEKSTLKRDSLLDYSGVSLSGHSMSEEQVRVLIGLNVDIIISLDSDVSIDEVRHMCSKFYGIRNVYYTYDKHSLIGKKDSIADAPNKIFEYLMKYKIKYDENEHKEYIKSLQK